MKMLSLALVPLLFASPALHAADAPATGPYAARIAKILKATPLIDGHNDWAEALAEKAKDARWTMDLTRLDPATYHTDITRLHAGAVGGQFWSVWVSADLPQVQQVKDTLDQIGICLLYTSPSPRDRQKSRMPSSA